MAQVRTLTSADTPAVLDLLGQDPFHHVFLEHHLLQTQLDSPWFGGQMFGYFADGELVAACNAAGNVTLCGAYDLEIAQAWVNLLRSHQRSSIVGRSDVVADLWSRLVPFWGPARSERLQQPLLAIETKPLVDPDPKVRRVLIDEFDGIYPHFVDMFTEEVGVNPELNGKEGYKSRVMSLLARGWSFARIENNSVKFKAEVGAATKNAAQLQGVYVPPPFRGLGLSAPALAAVVVQVQQEIAPVVTLYVNDHNTRALRLYENVGFTQIGTLATIYV